MARETTAIELARNVYRIPTTRWDFINSFAFVEDDGSVTLVDCGLRWTTKRLLAGLEAVGKGPGDVQRILITHAHFDHAGGLKKMVAATGAEVTAHEADAGYLRRGVPAPSENLVARIYSRLPGQGITSAPVTHTVTDREILDVAGGLEIIHTPGHTPGHISLLHRPTGVLITGDAIFNVGGLRYAPKMFCTDSALSRRTADVLGDLEYEVAAFTHGAEVRDGARDKVRGFLHKLPVRRS
jgi:glyoxylase-like metal-dependent hydrolase (beta-lactamase superfamily II)